MTEFLRSRGIRIENTRGRQAQPTTEATNTDTANGETESAESIAGASQANPAEEQRTLDAAVAEELAAALDNEKPKKRSKAGPVKKRKKGEEDEAWEPEEEPDYGRSGFSRKNRPAAGQIDFCAKCNCRFTVTVYNKASDGGGLLCSACGSSDTPGKAAARPKAKPAAKKRKAKAMLDGDTDSVPKLQDLTIKCIAKHIEDVEMLGDIGHVNMDKICQIISRNRSLNNDTVQLFLDASLKTLNLYDCAKLNRQKLTQVAQMCPHLHELRLHMVGQIDDSVLSFYGQHLKHLTSLALRGCFLITTGGWAKFFEVVGPRLELLELSDTSRFDAGTAKALVKNCPKLKSLTIRRATHLDDEAVAHLTSLKHLKKLDLGHAGAKVSDETIINLLQSCGKTLEFLDLSALRELTDAVVLEGIGKNCEKLQSLSLNDLDLLSDDGINKFFSEWSDNPPLLSLEIERCPLLHKEALSAILAHSGANLRNLNLNSMDELTREGILQIAETNALPMCESLDLSWIRAVDDLVLERLLENAPSLRKLLIWGNNRCTELVVSEKCLIVGRESA